VTDIIPEGVLKRVLTAKNLAEQDLQLSVEEGRLARQQDEEDNSTSPQVHCGAIFHAWCTFCLYQSEFFIRFPSRTFVNVQISSLAPGSLYQRRVQERENKYNIAKMKRTFLEQSR
jgi:hypothetical protein